MDALRPVELALAAAGRLADEALVLRLLELLAERAAGLEAELRTLELDELLDTLDEPRFVVEVVPEALVVRVVVSCEPDSLTRLLTVVWLVDALGVLLAAVLRLVLLVAVLRLVPAVAALRLVLLVLLVAALRLVPLVAALRLVLLVAALRLVPVVAALRLVPVMAALRLVPVVAALRLVPVVAALRLVPVVAALRLVPVVLEDAPLPVTLVVPPRVEPVLVTDDAS